MEDVTYKQPGCGCWSGGSIGLILLSTAALIIFWRHRSVSR